MTRILFVSLFIATLTMTALSQTQNQPENAPICNLSLSQAPVIRGIRLGMKPDEWLKLFPGSAQDEKIKAILDEPPKPPRYGMKDVVFPQASGQSQSSYLSREEFSGVQQVFLTLFDNQIVSVLIYYARYPDIGSPWDDVAQLIPIFSETFNLPPVSAWHKHSNLTAELTCTGFEMTVSAGNQPIIILTSKSDFREIIRQRAEADKLKARAAFKP